MDKEILYKFFDRRATTAEKKEIEQWLEESQENREKLVAEREFFAAMILSGKLREKEDLVKDSRKQGKTTFRYKTILRELGKIAAVIAITVTTGLFFLQRSEGGDALHTITVPSGQRANLTLPDGTKVWMNARTEIQYPGVFSKSKREIRLNGEAYFEVSHNAQQPFIVHTNKCSIEVLGTKFNVEDYADSKDFSTALMEGSVKVSDNKQDKNSLILSPDQLVVFKNGKLIAKDITDYDYYRWRDGLVCFKDVGFEQLMHRFVKCYGVKIVIENDRWLEYGFTGKFRVSDGIDNALKILQKEAPYTFRKNTDDSVIYIK